MLSALSSLSLFAGALGATDFTRIADTTQSSFNVGFAFPFMCPDDGHVVFHGHNNRDNAVWVSSYGDQAPTSVVSSDSKLPDGTAFTSIFNPKAGPAGVVWGAQTAGSVGIYAAKGFPSTQPYVTLVDGSFTIPRRQDKFWTVREPSMDKHGKVAFTGGNQDGTYRGVFTSEAMEFPQFGHRLQVLVDTDTPVPAYPTRTFTNVGQGATLTSDGKHAVFFAASVPPPAKDGRPVLNLGNMDRMVRGTSMSARFGPNHALHSEFAADARTPNGPLPGCYVVSAPTLAGAEPNSTAAGPPVAMADFATALPGGSPSERFAAFSEPTAWPATRLPSWPWAPRARWACSPTRSAPARCS